jgi:hypothetical protein
MVASEERIHLHREQTSAHEEQPNKKKVRGKQLFRLTRTEKNRTKKDGNIIR